MWSRGLTERVGVSGCVDVWTCGRVDVSPRREVAHAGRKRREFVVRQRQGLQLGQLRQLCVWRERRVAGRHLFRFNLLFRLRFECISSPSRFVRVCSLNVRLPLTDTMGVGGHKRGLRWVGCCYVVQRWWWCLEMRDER